MKQRFATTANIVDELEKAQVPGQFFLRDATMGTQPGTEQRPEAFKGVDMHFLNPLGTPTDTRQVEAAYGEETG